MTTARRQLMSSSIEIERNDYHQEKMLDGGQPLVLAAIRVAPPLCKPARE